FFFSSRRQQTISKRDWSSDVCSSDLILDQSPVNKPLNILTEPIITSSAPVITPLILPQTILMTSSTAHITPVIIGLMTVWKTHFTFSPSQVRIGPTNSHIF